MKNILLLFALSIFFSCNSEINNSNQIQDHAQIQIIENNLLPYISIEGEELPKWNIEDRMKHHNVPGVSIAFFDQGKILWTKCYGNISADSSKLVDKNTLFQAASISKPVAALGALLLVQDGKIDLDAPINDYLKSWKFPENKFTDEKKISLRHLLTHTGGLNIHGFGGYAFNEKIPTTNQILNGEEPANSGRVRADTFPEVRWKYSGGGFTIAQKMVEDVSGMPFHEYMQEDVLSKVGMTNSTYQQPLPKSFQANAAWSHIGNGNTIKGKWHTYPEQAAAGLWTTPSDLARFAIAIQDAFQGSEKEVLTPETAKAMLSKHLGDWGLGFGLEGEGDSLRFQHGGSNKGFKCRLVAFANLGQGVAIMTNGDNGRNLYSEILRSVSKAYQWNISNPLFKKLEDLTVAEKSKFEGTYQYTAAKEMILKLKMENEKLVVHQLWNKVSYEILPEKPLLFFDKNNGTPFEFILNKKGKIKEILSNNRDTWIKGNF